MKRLLLSVVAVAALALADSANAADLPTVKAPPVVAPLPYSWTGFYVGANVGYGFGSTTSEIPTIPDDVFGAPAGTTLPVSLGIDPTGFFGGGGAGYNWQTGNFLLGVEGDIQGSGIKSNLAVQTPTVDALGHGHTDWHNSASEDLQWFGTIRARTGLVFDRFLAYGTGGLAFGDVKVFNENAYNFNSTTWYTSNSTTTRVGWTAGGGVEYAVADRWTVKAEYLYYDLGTINSNAFNDFGHSGFVPSSLAVHGNLVRVGVDFKL
jgi:outer membrane immunogenic protein